MNGSRIANLQVINEWNWTIITWISTTESYLSNYGKRNEFDKIGKKIDWNFKNYF